MSVCVSVSVCVSSMVDVGVCEQHGGNLLYGDRDAIFFVAICFKYYHFY